MVCGSQFSLNSCHLQRAAAQRRAPPTTPPPPGCSARVGFTQTALPSYKPPHPPMAEILALPHLPHLPPPAFAEPEPPASCPTY
jgi:hypothetical protein